MTSFVGQLKIGVYFEIILSLDFYWKSYNLSSDFDYHFHRETVYCFQLVIHLDIKLFLKQSVFIMFINMQIGASVNIKIGRYILRKNAGSSSSIDFPEICMKILFIFPVENPDALMIY